MKIGAAFFYCSRAGTASRQTSKRLIPKLPVPQRQPALVRHRLWRLLVLARDHPSAR
jgi:hypothetical protein